VDTQSLPRRRSKQLVYTADVFWLDHRYKRIGEALYSTMTTNQGRDFLIDLFSIDAALQPLYIFRSVTQSF
jgi:hypothetical protein